MPWTGVQILSIFCFMGNCHISMRYLGISKVTSEKEAELELEDFFYLALEKTYCTKFLTFV